MATKSYTEADLQANLAEILDEVIAVREPVLITRRDSEAVALIAADELDSLLETMHLLRSPANAERLFAALENARNREGTATTLEALRAELGVDN